MATTLQELVTQLTPDELVFLIYKHNHEEAKAHR